MMKGFLTMAAATLFAGAVAAQNTQYLSTDGTVFAFEENRHGAVLTSIEPTETPLVIDGAAPRIAVGDILYLGRSCDAFSDDFGEGRWSMTSAGFIVEFLTIRLAFPGQTIGVGREIGCRL